MVTAVARLAAHLETDWLWFHELGQEQVFWTLLTTKWLAGSLAGIATTTVLLANFWVVARTAPAEARLPRSDPRTARLRQALLAGSLAISIQCGNESASLRMPRWEAPLNGGDR